MEVNCKRKHPDRTLSRRQRKRFSALERLEHQQRQADVLAVVNEKYGVLSSWFTKIFPYKLVPVLRAYSLSHIREFEVRFDVDSSQPFVFEKVAQIYVDNNVAKFVDFLLRFQPALLRDHTFLEKTVMDVFIFKRFNKQRIHHVLSSAYFSLTENILSAPMSQLHTLTAPAPAPVSLATSSSSATTAPQLSSSVPQTSTLTAYMSTPPTPPTAAFSPVIAEATLQSPETLASRTPVAAQSPSTLPVTTRSPSPPRSPSPVTQALHRSVMSVAVVPSYPKHCTQCPKRFDTHNELRRHLHHTHRILPTLNSAICNRMCTIVLISGSESSSVLSVVHSSLGGFLSTKTRRVDSVVSRETASVQCYECQPARISFIGKCHTSHATLFSACC